MARLIGNIATFVCVASAYVNVSGCTCIGGVSANAVVLDAMRVRQGVPFMKKFVVLSYLIDGLVTARCNLATKKQVDVYNERL